MQQSLAANTRGLVTAVETSMSSALAMDFAAFQQGLVRGSVRDVFESVAATVEMLGGRDRANELREIARNPDLF